jgi:tetratricopeptide (TPR) repeat protein
MKVLTTSLASLVLTLCSAMILSACNSTVLEEGAEIIRQQKIQIAEQEKIKEALEAKNRLEKQKQHDCNHAFREYFDKAQLASNRERTISLYREGLAICPDDDVAHYELGRALAAAGRRTEAEKSFEAALKINPDFTEARRQLEAVQKNR